MTSEDILKKHILEIRESARKDDKWEISYDSENRILYIGIQQSGEGSVHHSDEVFPGLIVDFDRMGRAIGFEVMVMDFDEDLDDD